MNIKDKVFSHEIIYTDGSSDGIIRAEVKINSVILYQIPRNSTCASSEESTSANEIRTYDELKHAGIYLLVNTENKTVYVGQADSRDNGNGLLARMLESHSSEEIDNWNFGYAITSGNPTRLLASELNYLEQFFYDEAKKVRRYKVLNAKRPHSKDALNLRMHMMPFIECVAFLLERIKCDIFIDQSDSGIIKPEGKKTQIPEIPEIPETPKVPDYYSDNVASPADAGSDAGKPEKLRSKKSQLSQEVIGKTFYLKNASKNVDAASVMSDTKSITVKTGATVSQNSSLSNQKGQEHAAAKRQELIDNGVIVDFSFVKDYLFSSTTIAAAVLLGQSANGITAWKDGAGKELKSYALSTGNP